MNVKPAESLVNELIIAFGTKLKIPAFLENIIASCVVCTERVR